MCYLLTWVHVSCIRWCVYVFLLWHEGLDAVDICIVMTLVGLNTWTDSRQQDAASTHTYTAMEDMTTAISAGSTTTKTPPGGLSPPAPLPLVITIGPQCSGKTTFLRKYRKIKDVSIDDVPSVYEKVPIQALISQDAVELVPDIIVYKRPLRDRVLEVQGSEIGLIIHRIFGLISAHQFAFLVRPLVQNDLAYAYMCEILEELLLQNLPLVSHQIVSDNSGGLIICLIASLSTDAHCRYIYWRGTAMGSTDGSTQFEESTQKPDPYSWMGQHQLISKRIQVCIVDCASSWKASRVCLLVCSWRIEMWCSWTLFFPCRIGEGRFQRLTQGS